MMQYTLPTGTLGARERGRWEREKAGSLVPPLLRL